MTDPWEKIRGALKYRTDDLAVDLLADCDALLAANVVLREALREIAHGKHSGRGYANQILAETSLPEHLKE